VVECQFDVPLTWNDLISLDTDDPAQQAMRKLNWESFTLSLDKRLKLMLKWIADGRTLAGMASKLKLSQTRVAQLKEKLVTIMQERADE
jgi:hypothetical protein